MAEVAPQCEITNWKVAELVIKKLYLSWSASKFPHWNTREET